MVAQITRRGFIRGLAATSALSALPIRLNAQALPAWSATPTITNSGRMIVQSVRLNGSTTALSIGDRVILSRAATQVAARATTRAVANRTMGLIATRLLGAAATVGPWGLAAAGLGVAAYGAYRFFTADDEAGLGNGTQYEVQYSPTGDATIRTSVSNNCGGLPSNSGGQYPNNVIIGAYNGSSGCTPGVRMKKVFRSNSTQRAGIATAPAGWNTAFTYDAGLVEQPDIHEWWVFYTRSLAGSQSAGWTPETFPLAIPATVPAALPADVRVKAPSPTSIADLANGIWQQSVPQNDTEALPWSNTNAALATEILPTIKPGAETVPDLSPGTIADLSVPRPQIIPNGQVVEFTFPESVEFPDDNPSTDPDTDPETDPGTGTVTVDWGPPPATEEIPSVSPMSWFPSLFAPPQLQGTCSGWTIPVTQGLPVTLDPCPLMAEMIPVVRPVIGVSATIAAGKILLDI